MDDAGCAFRCCVRATAATIDATSRAERMRADRLSAAWVPGSPFNIAAATLAYEPSVRLLTGNGPQAIDRQTARLRDLLTNTAAVWATGVEHMNA